MRSEVTPREIPGVVVVGIDHKTAPLEVLERFVFASHQLPEALRAVRALPCIDEAVILSTCNRAEIYVFTRHPIKVVAQLPKWIASFHRISPSEVGHHSFVHVDRAAVTHLFSVAAGIESMIIGESQILGQVRAAHAMAANVGVAGPVLGFLFSRAILAGRKARAESGIGCNESAITDAQVRILRERLGPLRGRRVLLIGAGKMGRLTAAAMAAERARIRIASRTLSQAKLVAARSRGSAVQNGNMQDAIAWSDALLCSTGSSDPVIGRSLIAGAMSKRPRRPLLIIDISVPRDVEVSAGELEGVSLVDLKSVRASVVQGESQLKEIERARQLVRSEASDVCDVWSLGRGHEEVRWVQSCAAVIGQ